MSEEEVCEVCGASLSQESATALENVLLVASKAGAMLVPEEGDGEIVLGRAEMAAIGALRAGAELAGPEFARALEVAIRRASENEIASLGGLEALRAREDS